MTHLGDIYVGEEINFKFSTVNTSGAPTVLNGTPVISVYRDNVLVQDMAGITLTVDFDGVVGLNNVNITTIGNAAFYYDRASYSAVITTGTVGGTSVVGYVVAQWKIRQTMAEQVWGQSVGALGGVSDSFASAIAEIWNKVGSLLDVPVSTRSSHTAADIWDAATRTLTAATNITSTGGTTVPQTGDNFARLGAPAGASVSADIAAVKAETASVQSDTNDIQTRIPAALVSGRIDASVGAMAADVLTNTALAASAVTEIQTGLATSAEIAAVQSDTDNIQTRLPTALINGRIASHVEDVSDGILTLPKFSQTYFDAITSYVWGASVGGFAPVSDSFGQIINDIRNELENVAGEVWDVSLSAHLSVGSTGAALNAAGSAGDPWVTSLPGAYGAGTAGFIIGTNVNATISSRLATAGYTVPPTVDAISDQVWDEAIAGHLGVGSTGEALNGAGGAGSTPDQIASAVWGYSVGASAAVSDSFAQAIGEMWNRIDTSISTRSSHAAADVWEVSVRLLTAGTNIALAKGTGVTGFTDLSAVDVRGAVGLASANLDTQLDALPTAAENADSIWDEVVDGATTARQSIRLVNSALGGKASGLATTNAKYRDLADTKDRIDATVDANGNRSVVTRDLT